MYREGDILYTKIFVNQDKDNERLFAISCGLRLGYFENEAEVVATKMATWITRVVPEHLLGEWKLANRLAGMPILDNVVETLIEKGLITPPEDGIGAEGCWMSVERV